MRPAVDSSQLHCPLVRSPKRRGWRLPTGLRASKPGPHPSSPPAGRCHSAMSPQSPWNGVAPPDVCKPVHKRHVTEPVGCLHRLRPQDAAPQGSCERPVAPRWCRGASFCVFQLGAGPRGEGNRAGLCVDGEQQRFVRCKSRGASGSFLHSPDAFPSGSHYPSWCSGAVWGVRACGLCSVSGS